MTGQTKSAASANATDLRIGEHSRQPAGTGYAYARSARLNALRIVTRRMTWAGHIYAVRFDIDDPHWRARSLATLDPHSDAAYVVRAIPPTAAERVSFAAWAERELDRIEAGQS